MQEVALRDWALGIPHLRPGEAGYFRDDARR